MSIIPIFLSFLSESTVLCFLVEYSTVLVDESHFLISAYTVKEKSKHQNLMNFQKLGREMRFAIDF